MKTQKQFRIKDCAVMLGLTKNQVYNLVKTNRIKASGTSPLRVNLDGIQNYLMKKIPVLVWYIPNTTVGRKKRKSI